MIIDRIENLEKYFSLNPLLKEVADFLSANDMNTLSTGIHQIKGNDVFVNIQEAGGKSPSEAIIEYHRRMVDVQIPFSGPETYGYLPTAEIAESDFNEETDCALVPGVKPQSYVTCTPGMFVIFFPQDGHAPFITHEALLRKAIFKIRNVEETT